MPYLITAYSLIAVVLAAYGASLYYRTRRVDRSARALDEEEA